MKLITGFLLLGFLVGDMAGLTSESVVSKLIALLFALFGGSFVFVYQKFTPVERGQIGLLIAAISVGMLLGIHTGIVTTQFRLLSPKPRPAVTLPVIATAANSPEQKAAPVVTQAQTATPTPTKLPKQPAVQVAAVAVPSCPDKSPDAYLKASRQQKAAKLIDSQLSADVITPAEAYRELHLLIEEGKR